MGFFKSIFKKKNKNHKFLIDRDLSWLKFNKRVLEEATNKNIPVLERIRFLSISGSNLDEFLMVRLAGLNRMQIDKIPINSLSGIPGNELISEIIKKLKEIHATQIKIWDELKKELQNCRHFVHKFKDLKKKDKEWLKNYFTNEILPLLTPISIFKNHPYPLYKFQLKYQD